MNFKDQETATKLRGGYYTPAPVAYFLAEWVSKKQPKHILEPSCGDGAFVRAFLRMSNTDDVTFTGIELLAEEAEIATLSLQQASFKEESEIINDDFLDWSINTLNTGAYYDAIVGNPPYIRYQYLEPKDQQLASYIFERYQLKFTKHTNAWVPFIIASIGLLTPGGRLGMVIPSEILHVLHANSLRQFLLEECHKILLIDPTELLFEDALQGTVLLMLEKKENVFEQSEGVSVVSAPNNDFLTQDPEEIYRNASYVNGDVLNGKWMKVLLSNEELNVLEKVLQLNSIKSFRDIASVDVGIVTGANKFFLVSDSTVNDYKLNEFVRPMFGRSEHCPGVIYDNKVHATNKERGLPTNFVMFGNTALESLPEKAREYIKSGEMQGLHTRYKCRIRKPWYSVPSIYSTPIGMLKRSHNFSRLILNSIDALTTDTAYRIRVTDVTISNEKLVFCFINSLTALTAELEGRHYGGGVLELVPSEVEKLKIPIPEQLSVNLKLLDEKIRNGIKPHILLAEQDKLVLKAAGLTDNECKTIQQAWARIRSRRHRLVAVEE